MANGHDVPIFINRRRYEVAPGTVSGSAILAVAGLGEGYDLLLLNGEGDPTGGELILGDQQVAIRAGLHFRAIPGNRTFGSNVPLALVDDADELSNLIQRPIALSCDGHQVFVIVDKARLPADVYSSAESDVLMVTDHQYPMSSMDMFWMEERITLANGSIPSHSSTVETYAGRRWRRWSWHRNGLWTPGVDDLRAHWAFVEACWMKESGLEPASVR